ncbi:MAG: hypothetical protein Q8K75_10670 [Chlamydiales bacterium]|nr:hypothetical protein [Chlamydiales bacterium]
MTLLVPFWSTLMGAILALMTFGVIVPNEDGPWETVEAVMLSLTLICYLWYIVSSWNKLPKMAIPTLILFALLIVAGLGEETKWGIGWSVKDTYDLHQFDNVVVHALLIVYGVMLPLFAFIFFKVRYALDQVRLPWPHLAFSPWIVLVLVSEPFLGSEAREIMLYMLFLGAVLFSTSRWRKDLHSVKDRIA